MSGLKPLKFWRDEFSGGFLKTFILERGKI
jgi:hypothetical protein